MREIKDREEIAKVLNFGAYPVIRVNLDQKPFMDAIYTGDKVRVDMGKFKTGERFLEKGELLYNVKENRFSISSYGTMLVKDKYYRDYKQDWEYAISPILDEEQEVVIILHSDIMNGFKVLLGKTKGKRKFCQTLISIE